MPLAIEQEHLAALPYEAEEYLMIEKLHIENYRCFKSTSVEGLKRVNIIVGKNASGKSVFLESIKLGLDGLPVTFLFFSQLRNIPINIPQYPTLEQFQSLFVDFFHLLESKDEIVISAEDSKHAMIRVRVHFDPTKTTTIQPQIGFQLPQQSVAPPPPPTTIIPLVFERTDFQGQKDIKLATVNAQGQLFLEPGKPIGPVSGIISSKHFGGPGEIAMWLSQLSIDKRDKEVIKAIKRHFPLILDLSSETPSMGGLGTVYADINGLPRKIPISLVSDGISRLFTMILAVVQYKNGVTLIDEIENGIYFDQYPKVWRTLVDLAKHHNTQLFITTHSLECLRGALDTIKGNEEDFLLLRVEKENGKSKITPIEAKFTEAAIEQGFDVR